MTIGLGKVAEHSASDRIELLGQQSDIVATREQALKQPSRIFVSILQKIVVDQPKAASQESALAGREPIDAVLGFIPQDKLILDRQPLLNRFERSANLWVIGWKKTNEGNQKQTCVQARRAEGLHEAIDLSVEPALAHFRVYFIGDPSPFSPGLMKRFGLDAARRAIERDPRHHLGMHEVLSLAAHFPNAFVRFPPDFSEVIEDDGPQGSRSFGQLQSVFERLKHDVGDFAEDVELRLS